MDASIFFRDLQAAIRSGRAPLIIDVRPRPVFKAAKDLIAGALWRDPTLVASWARELPGACKVVTYCVHGHNASQGVARALNELGIATRYLEGGLDDGWKVANGELAHKPVDAYTRWVTRERPKIDRIACPWLIARFIDRDAEFLYAPAKRVLEVAKGKEAIPYDIPDVAFFARRRALQLRRVSQAFSPERPRNAAVGAHRQRRRHREARYRAAGRGALGGFDRVVPHRRRRP